MGDSGRGLLLASKHETLVGSYLAVICVKRAYDRLHGREILSLGIDDKYARMWKFIIAKEAQITIAQKAKIAHSQWRNDPWRERS